MKKDHTSVLLEKIIDKYDILIELVLDIKSQLDHKVSRTELNELRDSLKITNRSVSSTRQDISNIQKQITALAS